jgi:hypothetical protein
MATTNIYDLSDTWNNAGTTFSAIKMDVTNTASAAASKLLDLQIASSEVFVVRKTGAVETADGSAAAPSYSFTGDTDTGMYRVTTNVAAIAVGGARKTQFAADHFRVYDAEIQISDSAGSNRVHLARDAANTLALRNGTASQGVQVYSTYTDASNYERAYLGWVGNDFAVGTFSAGTGANRRMVFYSAGSQAWEISPSLDLRPINDNGDNIGSIFQRVRNIWARSFHSATDDGAVTWGTAQDLFLVRDAANTLAQRNSTNSQTFRVYGTYTDASNYERAELRWDSSSFVLETVAAGTGTAQSLFVRAGATLFLGSGGNNRWQINNTTGHLVATADNTYDIGASGANRPRDLHIARNIHATGLPTSDPSSAGQLWNDSGTLKVSAG